MSVILKDQSAPGQIIGHRRPLLPTGGVALAALSRSLFFLWPKKKSLQTLNQWRLISWVEKMNWAEVASTGGDLERSREARGLGAPNSIPDTDLRARQPGAS
jgi:hypothetical protein